MAISNMQQSRQLRAGGGIMDLEPRQKYGFGSFVKKAFKKVAKPKDDAKTDSEEVQSENVEVSKENKKDEA